MTSITNFSEKVYKLCSQIPKGKVSTYKLLADFLHTSPRAVGQSLKKNPFPSSLVPCHRVIQSNYFLGGFFGKEIELKKVKLEQEGIYFDNKGYLSKNLSKKEIIFRNFFDPKEFAI